MPSGSRTVGVATGPAASLAALGVPTAPPGDVGRVLVPVDWQSVGLMSAPAAGAGAAMTITLPAPDVGHVYRVERIAVSTTLADSTTVATVYVGDPAPHNIADRTTDGDGGPVGDQNQPILVPGGVPLTIQWTGAGITAGAI